MRRSERFTGIALITFYTLALAIAVGVVVDTVVDHVTGDAPPPTSGYVTIPHSVDSGLWATYQDDTNDTLPAVTSLSIVNTGHEVARVNGDCTIDYPTGMACEDVLRTLSNLECGQYEVTP